MKNITLAALFFMASLGFSASAQEATSQEATSHEKFGGTLNLGLGIGYYGYLSHSIPVINLNYEFDVAKNFTLAPTISFYKYRNSYYWGNKNYPYRYYAYNETVIPVGAKGTYYFDDLLKAASKWDFYLAGSLGLVIVNSNWENGYYGEKDYYHRGSSLFFDLHIGTEYHFNKNIGAFLDLSSGVSTIGIAIH